MHKLICINRAAGKNGSTLSMLESACLERGIGFEVINSASADFSVIPHLTRSDLLYTVSDDHKSQTLTRLLVATGSPTHLFHDDKAAMAQYEDEHTAGIIYASSGLPAIPTVFSLTRDRVLLKKYVEALGGFPIVIKALGGSHGVGVMRCDSYPNLFSVADFLGKLKDKKYMLRAYIDYKSHAKLVVLGDEVIASTEYEKVCDDFRSNAGHDLHVRAQRFDRAVEQVAVQATRALGLDFAGVDVLIDKHGQPFIAETNFPNNFSLSQKLTGVDIAGKLVDWLGQKAGEPA